MAIQRTRRGSRGSHWIGMGISLGIGLSLGGHLSLDQVSWAQQTEAASFSPEQIEVFAQVVLAMEPHRVEAHERSQATEDSQAQDQIRREFIRKATEIITDHGMTVPDYNRFVLTLQGEDSDLLKQQIEAQIRQIQLSNPIEATQADPPN